MTIDDKVLYIAIAEDMKRLFLAKNADYGSSFRTFRQTTFLDLIRAKLQRIETLLELAETGELPAVSEGIEAKWKDIGNYAILATIMFNENRR